MSGVAATRVDGDDQVRRPELLGRLSHEIRTDDGRGVDRDLVRAGAKQSANVCYRSHATTDRERNRESVCRARDQVEHRRSVLVRRVDVEQAELVRSLRIVSRAHLDRIPGVDQVDELHALHDAPVAHVETGNDSLGQHARSLAIASSTRIAPE